jgi:glutamate---cysteine ligase / carboxylate-amine ligase
MMIKNSLPIFAGYGVELEYMIVNCDDLAIFPLSDQLIHDVTGKYVGDVEFEQIAWSNELVLHVIELKTNGPAVALEPLDQYFQEHIRQINNILGKYNAQLLPTGAHPWMNPYIEAKLWPHDHNIIYETYHKIFDCRGHGWSNLQSTHLNLPFSNDEEFARLHTAIRLLLPIIPALSASTPIINGRPTGMMDTRLEYYRNNQQKIPSITGHVIPEIVFSESEYEERILKRMYDDIAIHDPEKILQEEWLNSRGAIARFDRNTIEIRVLDTQECPSADLAILRLIVATLKAFVYEKWLPFKQQAYWLEQRLQQIFLNVIKSGMNTVITDEEYLQIFGIKAATITARDLWQHVVQELISETDENSKLLADLGIILREGNLAERILKSIGSEFNSFKMKKVYQKLAECLQTAQLFLPIYDEDLLPAAE